MTIRESYNRGFISKCASAGVDPTALIKFSQETAKAKQKQKSGTGFTHNQKHTLESIVNGGKYPPYGPSTKGTGAVSLTPNDIARYYRKTRAKKTPTFITR